MPKFDYLAGAKDGILDDPGLCQLKSILCAARETKNCLTGFAYPESSQVLRFHIMVKTAIWFTLACRAAPRSWLPLSCPQDSCRAGSDMPFTTPRNGILPP